MRKIIIVKDRVRKAEENQVLRRFLEAARKPTNLGTWLFLRVMCWVYGCFLPFSNFLS